MSLHSSLRPPKINECSSPDSAPFDILFCLLRTWSFTLFTNSAASPSHDKRFRICLFLIIDNYQVAPSWIISPYLTEKHFRREEVLHDEGQLVASHSRKFHQVSLIDRASQLHFSTLEKTKIDHNPLLHDLLVTVYQVSLIDRVPQQISQDFVSMPGPPRVWWRTEGILSVNSS